MKLKLLLLVTVLFSLPIFAKVATPNNHKNIDLVVHRMNYYLKYYQVERLKINADPQFLESSPAVARAFGSALDSIIHDGSDLESPLGLAIEEVYGQPYMHAKAVQMVTEQLNTNSNITVCSAFTSHPNRELGECWPAEHGETLKDNWVFEVRSPDAYDYLIWAIVPKNDFSKSYVYGFN